MANINLRPDATISAGAWSIDDGLIPALMSDESDAATVFNTTGNQSMVLRLDDVPEELGELRFLLGRVTVNAKAGGKGPGNFTTTLLNEEETVVSAAFVVEEEEILEYSTAFADVSEMDLETVNGLVIAIETTNDGQVYFSEAYLTISYEGAATADVVKLTSGAIKINAGKVSLV